MRWEYYMTPLQRRISVLNHSTAHLIAQLRELDGLREKVRKAQLFSKRSAQPKSRIGNSAMPRFALEPTARDPILIRGGAPETGGAGLKLPSAAHFAREAS
jgi:hypothetical protein